MRDHSSHARNGGDRPSLRFNWDHALTLHALAMFTLGYPLSADQKRRIEDYAHE